MSSLPRGNQSIPDPRLNSVEPAHLYSRAALSTVSVDGISVSPGNNTCVQNVSKQLPMADDQRMMACSVELEERAVVQQDMSVFSLLQDKQLDERYKPVRNYTNGELPANSLSDDTDLCMDDIRSAENIPEGRILSEPRPESLAGANVTPDDGLEVPQLSLGSFDNSGYGLSLAGAIVTPDDRPEFQQISCGSIYDSGHDSADSFDKDLTTLKRSVMSESGYTPSSPELSLNQTDDAKIVTLDLCVDPMNTSEAVDPVNTSGSVDPVNRSGAVDPVNTNCAAVGKILTINVDSQCSERITDTNALATAGASDSPVSGPNSPSIASEAVHINGDANKYSEHKIIHARLCNMCYFMVKSYVKSDLAFM